MKRSFFRRILFSQYFQIFKKGFQENNPIFVIIMGFCSTLAVTNQIKNAVIMWIAVTISSCLSSTTISLIRKQVPLKLKTFVFLMIISTLVITIERCLRILAPDVSQQIGPYIGLIITNCILLGRVEAFALYNPPGLSFFDALGVTTGYGVILFLISIFREVLGAGTFLNLQVLPQSYPPCEILSSGAGGFLVLASFIFFANYLKEKFSA
ncbi:MAG: NADH:ubiquinone reductase (Na(+)-transporting) subunit D [Candidatus Riflebacteria bacterium]|nr:NADH:ubiquinone reductase (Na(+)-transporting) subunit D [Candidatus Riflebacteria bacterium]